MLSVNGTNVAVERLVLFVPAGVLIAIVFTLGNAGRLRSLIKLKRQTADLR